MIKREAAKKLIKAERKKLRAFSKEHDLFAVDDDERVHHLTELEKMCEVFTLDQLTNFNNQLQNSQEPRETFIKELESMNASLYAERMKGAELSRSGPTAEKVKSKNKEWSHDELQLLIKAVNLFPAGTVQRWEVVAEFINQHTPTPEIKRYAKETLSQAKDMQSGNFDMSKMKDAVNNMAFENLQKSQKRDTTVVECAADLRVETPAEAMGLNTTPWAAEEQKLLEQSLKTFPSSTPERWDRIAECLPGRSKKDCMKRYKELAELIRAKKAAQAATKKS